MPWLIVLSGYFLGAFPTAYIAGRLLTGGDIRQMGDGNMGAQNAFRQLGPKTGVAVGLIDAGKGILVILLAQTANISLVATLTAGLTAVIGHILPVYISFRGGRGESATLGVLLMVMTQPVLLLAAPAFIVLLIRKNVSLASACFFIPLPLVGWWLGFPFLVIAYCMALPVLVGFTHLLRSRWTVMRRA